MDRTTKELDQRLADIPILSGLSRRQRHKLLDAGKAVDHREGHEVAAEGEGSLALHVILDGSATVSLQGRTIRTLREGDYFGEISLIDGKPRSATVAADGPLQTFAVPHAAFKQVIMEDPAGLQSLLVALCARLREAESK